METADEYSVAPTDSTMIIMEIAKALDASPEERKKQESHQTNSLHQLEIWKERHREDGQEEAEAQVQGKRPNHHQDH